MARCSSVTLLLVEILRVSIAIQLKTNAGINYGQDCKPSNSMDQGVLEKVVAMSAYKEKFGDGPIQLLTDEEWTVEMEDAYAEGLLGDEGRCSLIEGLDCCLTTNGNNREVNFHHHHPGSSSGKGQHSDPSTSLFEPRRADVVEGPNYLNFDVLTELEPEWRCVCNPITSVHNSVKVTDSSVPYPYYNDMCLLKVGFPCKYKQEGQRPAHYFKAEYPCVPHAECLVVTSDPSNATGSNAVAGVQAQIEKKVGYQLNLGGFRPAYVSYVVRYLTHVCQCVQGYKPNGNGFCVNGQGLEGRGGDLNGNCRVDSSAFLNLLLIIVKFLKLTDY